MKAAVLRDGAIVTDTVDEPKPGNGQVLVRTVACGICGSDLHAAEHGHAMTEINREIGGAFDVDFARDVVMGHEFVGELVDFGPGSDKRVPVGTRVCSVPMILSGGAVTTVGYSNDYPGGFGEFMVLDESLILPVPSSVPDGLAALTEPLAVGVHAVARAGVEPGDVPLVVGCGPVGLAVIAALKIAGIDRIVAADYSPGRRALAARMGATDVVDPATVSAYESWKELAAESGLMLLPHAMPGVEAASMVAFECVGVPGVVDAMMRGAPACARIVVVGVCMEEDRILPLVGINKELDLRFAFAYSAEEYAATLTHMAEGRVDAAPLVTGRVGLDGVAGAFAELAQPDRHAKILVEPSG
jgi:threonine dehydrogenase-like Zn-dependent dehydrogenase